jgi:hypothetical protein
VLRFASRRIRIAVVLGLLLAGAGALALYVNSKLDTRQESFYPSMADAKKDGAIDRGWIPDQYLPRSSRSIREVRDLSPSKEWCAFDFDPFDVNHLQTNMRPLDPLSPPIQYIPKPGVPWWPSVLENRIDVQKIHNNGFDLYYVQQPANSVTTQVWVFAVSHTDVDIFSVSED